MTFLRAFGKGCLMMVIGIIFMPIYLLGMVVMLGGDDRLMEWVEGIFGG